MTFVCELCEKTFDVTGLHPLRLCHDCNKIRTPESRPVYKRDQEAWDRFAAAALTGLIANPNRVESQVCDDFADRAALYAAAIIKVRSKRKASA